MRVGESCFHHLERDPTVLLDKPYHSLFFYLPRAALDVVAVEANVTVTFGAYAPAPGVIVGAAAACVAAMRYVETRPRLGVQPALKATALTVAEPTR